MSPSSSPDGSRLTAQLHEIAQNLWWAGQPDVWQIFKELDATAWEESGHNPLVFLDKVDSDQLEALAHERALSFRIQQARRRLREYVEAGGPKQNMEAGPLHVAPVAYFCAEFGLHESLRIYFWRAITSRPRAIWRCRSWAWGCSTRWGIFARRSTSRAGSASTTTRPTLIACHSRRSIAPAPRSR